MNSFSQTVSSVGAVVVRADSVLVARLTYSPTKGQYMLPRGVVENGETLDIAVRREVREETGVDARALGVIGISSIVYAGATHTYTVWLMEPLSGEPIADGQEVDHCCFMSFDEIAAREDVAYLVNYVAERVRRGAFALHAAVADFTEFLPGLTSDTWRLFM